MHLFTRTSGTLIGQKVINLTRRHINFGVDFTFTHSGNHHLITDFFPEFRPGDPVFFYRLTHLLRRHLLISGHANQRLFQFCVIHLNAGFLGCLHLCPLSHHLVKHLLPQYICGRQLHFLAM